MLNIGTEPVAILSTISAILIAVQQLALNIPAGVHTVIAIVLVAIAAIVARAKVTPV